MLLLAFKNRLFCVSFCKDIKSPFYSNLKIQRNALGMPLSCSTVTQKAISREGHSPSEFIYGSHWQYGVASLYSGKAIFPILNNLIRRNV